MSVTMHPIPRVMLVLTENLTPEGRTQAVADLKGLAAAASGSGDRAFYMDYLKALEEYDGTNPSIPSEDGVQ